MTRTPLDPWLQAHLACPRDGSALTDDGAGLACLAGHRYPCVDGIPILLLDDVVQTHWIADYTLAHLDESDPVRPPDDPIDPFVRRALGGTCGNLYVAIQESVPEYPIPRFPLAPFRRSDVMLEVGCNWGRWCIGAARAGFQVVGVDPSLPAIRAARRVASQLGVSCTFVVADARHLPFAGTPFDAAFSYSVLQHFSPEDAQRSINEIGRVLKPGGRALVQMPNRFGVRNLLQRARRRFATPGEFEVRYWTPGDLLRAFERGIGPARADVDSFFSLNARVEDLTLLPRRYRPVVLASECLRRASERLHPLVYAADSLYLHATRRPPA